LVEGGVPAFVSPSSLADSYRHLPREKGTLPFSSKEKGLGDEVL